MIIEFKGMRPDIDKAAYIAENATISGDVTLGENSSVWFNAVMRAEVAPITIGALSNVQDHVMLHADYDCPVTIGERVSIGHSAIVHGATIEDRVIVGMGAIVMNGAVIGEGSIIAAGALVKEGMVVPPYSLVAGVPGVVKKTFEPGQRPQENNDEVYTDDAFAYAAAPHYPVPVK
ncbi:gamma carbonic anhydrase family protein [uncultured Slackia sp.]|uniref:gamma carbonic anhydrase family protein n=1 Tax=uncultured Slackia sp. TaxID=665903 RepID=UPI0026E089F7|nr:gamma carbonic anhydrase family protein [uncultured Slackia sp.]